MVESDTLDGIGIAWSGRTDGTTQLLLARHIQVMLLAQPPAGVLRHANAHRGGPEEIGSEQAPERNGTVPCGPLRGREVDRVRLAHEVERFAGDLAGDAE